MKLQIANRTQINQIFSLYKSVVEAVSKTSVKLGWNAEIYPSLEWIKETVSKNEMLIFSEGENIIGACCVNHIVNDEYKLVDWRVKEPENKISTIHAFCIHPDYWGKGENIAFLNEVLSWCRKNGDAANHLDVIDTNDKAVKMYLKAGFELRTIIEMYYEVVGTRKFSMLEYIFD